MDVVPNLDPTIINEISQLIMKNVSEEKAKFSKLDPREHMKAILTLHFLNLRICGKSLRS